MERNLLMSGYIVGVELGVYGDDPQYNLMLRLRDNKDRMHLLHIDYQREELNANVADIATALIYQKQVTLVSDGSEGCHFEAVNMPEHRIVFRTINWSYM